MEKEETKLKTIIKVKKYEVIRFTLALSLA